MAKRLLMQSDDYGITDAVSAGIREAIAYGLIRNTGMFVNMEASERAARDIKDMDVCLGIDINYVCGRPVSAPGDVPHLVDKQGMFISSGDMASKNEQIGTDELGLISSFKNDPYPYEEIKLETENQVRRFIELVGRKPEYIHFHSLTSDNCFKAAKEVASDYGIIHSIDMMHRCRLLPGTFGSVKGDRLETQMEYDVVGNLITKAIPSMQEEEDCCFICHCGYVDYELFENTTLTLRRVKDLYAMKSNILKDFIEDQKIELITYRELGEI